MQAETQLDGFLAKYDPAIEGLARALMTRMNVRLPGATRIVYDNFAGLVIGYGADDKASKAILSLLVVPRWVTLCFLQGALLDDPAGVLRGDGNQVRNIRMLAVGDFDHPTIEPLIAQAIANSERPMPDKGPGPLIIKSVSVKQRLRRPA